MKSYKIITMALFAIFIVGCGNNSSQRTPTETLQALNEAGKKKDAAGVKKLLSKGSLELLEKSAKLQNKTSDEFLTQEGAAPFQNISEFGSEKIEGEKAIVEVKTVFFDEFELIPLVKEDGEWKVALDVYAKDVEKRLTEQMKSPVVNSNVAPNTNIAPTNGNQTNSKSNTNQNSAVNEFKSVQNRLRNK